MSAQALQSLIGAALTDDNFRLGLLNGSRQHLLAGFPLTNEELQTVMSIRADSLEQFASEIHRRLITAEDESLPPLQRWKKVQRAEPSTEWRAEPPRDSRRGSDAPVSAAVGDRQLGAPYGSPDEQGVWNETSNYKLELGTLVASRLR
jgi:hypothetical protein